MTYNFQFIDIHSLICIFCQTQLKYYGLEKYDYYCDSCDVKYWCAMGDIRSSLDARIVSKIEFTTYDDCNIFDKRVVLSFTKKKTAIFDIDYNLIKTFNYIVNITPSNLNNKIKTILSLL